MKNRNNNKDKESEDFIMSNMPELKIGVVAVSRDCFPESLSVNRRKALIDAYTKNMVKELSMNVRSVS